MFRKREAERAMRKMIREITKVRKIATSSGNWDYNQYFHGMANGLILAESLFTRNRDPKYLDAPDEWGKDKVVYEKWGG